MQSKQRQPGYYWVKWNMGRKNGERWQVAAWSNGWSLYNMPNPFGDDFFTEINETRIPSPDEKAALPFIDEDEEGRRVDE